jgi:hypothetical protein
MPDGTQWIFYVVIIFNSLSFVLHVLLVPETQYIVDAADPSSGRVGVRYWPWQRPREYLATMLRPLVISRYVALTLPATYYGIVFGFFVGATVIMPRLLGAQYGFSTQAIGLSYLTYAVGSILGKTAGGWVGDRMVLWKQARTGERHPEYRLWPMVSHWTWLGDNGDSRSDSVPAPADSAGRRALVWHWISESYTVDRHSCRRGNVLHGLLGHDGSATDVHGRELLG